MLFNPFQIQQVEEDRMRDMLREVERDRLARAAKDARKVRRLLLMPVLSALVHILARIQS